MATMPPAPWVIVKREQPRNDAPGWDHTSTPPRRVETDVLRAASYWAWREHFRWHPYKPRSN